MPSSPSGRRDQAILQSETVSGRMTTRSGTFEARITEIDLLDADGRPARAFTVGDHGADPGTRAVHVAGRRADGRDPDPRPGR